jgi:glycerol-3-phosphate cytidylyltransferase
MSQQHLVTVYADVVCDLFHAGHVEFFRQARALGDRLIVGLVSDANVETYKPSPIMTLAERVAVVSTCCYVDSVVPDCPLFCTPEFLDSIGADFACHGDDFSPESVRYYYGALIPSGRLRIVHYTSGISSRDIVERVAARLKDGSLRIKL